MNIGRLEGGVADNVVAPSAEARLMARIVGPSDDVWTLLKQWIAGRAQLERSVEIPAMRLGTVPGFPTSVVAFATDIPAMPAWGTPYLFGPGSIHVAHRDDEHVVARGSARRRRQLRAHRRDIAEVSARATLTIAQRDREAREEASAGAALRTRPW